MARLNKSALLTAFKRKKIKRKLVKQLDLSLNRDIEFEQKRRGKVLQCFLSKPVPLRKRRAPQEYPLIQSLSDFLADQQKANDLTTDVRNPNIIGNADSADGSADENPDSAAPGGGTVVGDKDMLE